jgi:hypothetical protein
MDKVTGERILKIRERIVSNFTAENWEEIGLLTGGSDIIDHHSRLLRSLSWNDEDYSGNVLSVIKTIVEHDPRQLPIIEEYLDKHFEQESLYVSAKPAERKVTFSPYVFDVPDCYPEPDLISLMMPFSKEFTDVSNAIKQASENEGFRCLRGDDIWEESTIIQDIFNLIYKSQIVIVDFTGKNPNVMYETGIAHTLGKHVIPISQSIDDAPFDMRHHRVLKYLHNGEGLDKLVKDLSQKISQYSPYSTKIPKDDSNTAFDDLPF